MSGQDGEKQEDAARGSKDDNENGAVGGINIPGNGR